MEYPSNIGYCAVIDSSSDLFDLAEVPDEKNGGKKMGGVQPVPLEDFHNNE